MAITDVLVLPADVTVIPIKDLSEKMRAQFEHNDGDFVISRPRARTSSKVIDAEAASLLLQFKIPKTFVDAVISYSVAADVDPKETLHSAYPLIRFLIQSDLLVVEGTADAKRITQLFDFGDEVGGCTVVYCIQVLRDTELYQVKRPDGRHAVLKILRSSADKIADQMLTREVKILGILDGTFSPTLVDSGVIEDRAYLLMNWCSGVDATMAAHELRTPDHASSHQSLAELCTSILYAYSHLHAQNIVHGDIHPRNLVIDSKQAVKIVDFGLARLNGLDPTVNRVPRGGVGFFYEPEYAKAALSLRPPPQANELGEQYALAALIFHLFTGSHYLDFSMEREVMLRQIVEERPLSFTHWDVPSSPEVERTLGKALSKAPEDRFPSVTAFAEAFGQAAYQDSTGRSQDRTVHRATELDTAYELLNKVLLELEPDNSWYASGLPVAPICSVMAGAGGVAYALYRIACTRESPRLLAHAKLWIAKAIRDSGTNEAFTNEKLEATPETLGAISPFHTISGLYVVQALLHHVEGQPLMQQAAIESFVQESQARCDNLDLTLGRSSTLLACSLLLDTMIGSDFLDENSLRALGNRTMAGIWKELNNHPAILEATELTNLGIAHGWAGFLYATMRWCRSSGSVHPDQVEVRLEQLTEMVELVGRGARWKWTLERPSSDSSYLYMPGWCNGSAGYVHLWTLAYQWSHDEMHMKLAELAAWNAWEWSQHIDSLCCGLAGRAYALLDLYKHTGESVWLDRARVLAEAASVADPTPNMPAYSLYKGRVGIAVLVADLENPTQAAMPFFAEEGWPK